MIQMHWGAHNHEEMAFDKIEMLYEINQHL
jgi:hypothetical protein